MRNTSRQPRRALSLAACAVLSLAALAGCHKADTLVGHWTTTIPIGPTLSAQWAMDFKADGTETQNINAPGQAIAIQGKYTTKDATLTQTIVRATRNGQAMPAGTTSTMTFTLKGDTLKLSTPSSPRPLIFHRVNS